MNKFVCSFFYPRFLFFSIFRTFPVIDTEERFVEIHDYIGLRSSENPIVALTGVITPEGDSIVYPELGIKQGTTFPSRSFDEWFG